ncbi:hypothetical protein BBO99_00003600 [Phytophthora kernoviae]|uniref:HTH myb-type domain-containing protein n=2 Tax=Phytophthora kernoviae TaxID=325452 RepID=A0A3R7JAS5_9STRA|nr:hypothetical protein G195_007850 [Phytophthora kernoviae 00238/432]KAG2523651.1 hypothetical protein JM16_003286 [Phytophthora kernoviae]KAG2529084.1 hypothetical protein JM18_002946 [Phytophthora kernoviae]RLN27309.1 hypothetical protein BBI17_003727 [Phytophthora kernoviae]RLN81581.1 hypothetical protein BBO99_00003600 [Phytophthora kernoviae]
MGMACDAEGRAVTGEHIVPLEKTSGACSAQVAEEAKVDGNDVAETPGLNPEETAMILTSLCKGKFSGNAASREAGDSDEDMDEFSDDDEDSSSRRHHSRESHVGKVHRVQQINFDGPKGSKLDFMDDAGFSHRFRNESNRVKSLVTKHISIDELRAHFDRPIIDVAKDFGICITLMKKICRRNGIKRWPHRQIRSLSKSIASMEAAMLSAHGSEREKYRDQIVNLKMKRESVIADPNKDNTVRPKTMPPSLMRCDFGGQGMDASFHQVPSAPKLSLQTGSNTPNGDYPVTPTVKMESLAEHAAFLEGIRLYGKDWRRVAQVVMTRSAVQTRTHAQKYLLKFAGRFPFDADGVIKDQQERQQPQVQPQFSSNTVVIQTSTPMLSPTASVATSNAAMTPASDDCVSNASWNSEEQSQAPTKHGEAMAMILNSSPNTQPDVDPRGDNTESAALPPLALRLVTTQEEPVPINAQLEPQEAVPAAFQYFQQPEQQQQLAP